MLLTTKCRCAPDVGDRVKLTGPLEVKDMFLVDAIVTAEDKEKLPPMMISVSVPSVGAAAIAARSSVSVVTVVLA